MSKPIRILISVATAIPFVEMSDGTYRWLGGDCLHLMPDGPDSGWVRRGLTACAASPYGEPSIQEHPILGRLFLPILAKTDEMAVPQ